MTTPGYAFNQYGALVRDDGAVIPADNGNKDYVVYREWVGQGNKATAYVAPKTVPGTITDRQFFQQCAVQGIITQAEALAANAAVIPNALLALVGQLPADQQFGAKMLIGGETIFHRVHPMVNIIGTAYGFSSDQMDDFFIAAALL